LVKFHIPLNWSECFHESICKALDFLWVVMQYHRSPQTFKYVFP